MSRCLYVELVNENNASVNDLLSNLEAICFVPKPDNNTRTFRRKPALSCPILAMAQESFFLLLDRNTKDNADYCYRRFLTALLL
ncbi:hypothetical protein A0E43_02295 [Pectobacterium cacticida]